MCIQTHISNEYDEDDKSSYKDDTNLKDENESLKNTLEYIKKEKQRLHETVENLMTRNKAIIDEKVKIESKMKENQIKVVDLSKKLESKDNFVKNKMQDVFDLKKDCE